MFLLPIYPSFTSAELRQTFWLDRCKAMEYVGGACTPVQLSLVYIIFKTPYDPFINPLGLKYKGRGEGKVTRPQRTLKSSTISSSIGFCFISQIYSYRHWIAVRLTNSTGVCWINWHTANMHPTLTHSRRWNRQDNLILRRQTNVQRGHLGVLGPC